LFGNKNNLFPASVEVARLALNQLGVGQYHGGELFKTLTLNSINHIITL